MADYASMKVPELKKLLAERKLPQTGNKADLIARLRDEDNRPADAKPVAAKDDEITYSDDEGARLAAAAAAAASTSTATPAVAKDAASTDGAKTTSTTEADKLDAAACAGAGANPTATAAESTAPAPSFAMGLDASTADEEAKKRAERAKRFGIDEHQVDEDAKKRVERAKRFGLDRDVSGLDSALPERSLKRGRGHQQQQQQQQNNYRAGKRQSTERNGRHGRNMVRDGGVLDDPVERAKAEKRAARFAAA